MQIAVMADNDYNPRRKISAHYGPRWKFVRYNGAPARAEWLREESMWRDKVRDMPDDALVQSKLVDGQPAFRAKPRSTA